VNVFIQEAARQDILDQVEWYARQGLPQIARRFHAAALDAIDALLAMPEAGPPKATGNPRLAGLRSWSVKDFDAFWVYYIVQPERLTVVRVLHSKQDTGAILEEQDVEKP
jgi:toxin ParE1/3/4